MKKVAFVCIHNSCRSIIAEAFAKYLGQDVIDAYSAGTAENSKPKPLAIEVMEDIGYDMSYAHSKLLNTLPKDLDILVTMGCGIVCPNVFSKHKVSWNIVDPSGMGKPEFVKTREIIKQEVQSLIKDIKNNKFA